MAEAWPSVHRVFGQLDQAAFEQGLGQWFAAQGLQADEASAMDGKPLRGIHGEDVPGVHLVAAFAHQPRTVLAQAATEGKDHDLAGVRAVLAALPVRRFEWARGDRGGAVGPAGPLSPDHCQRGDSFVVLKGNQPLTLEAVAVSFDEPWSPRKQVVEGARHGDREERRTVEASTEVVASLAEPEAGAEEEKTGDWPGGPGLSFTPRGSVSQRAASGGADERVGHCPHQSDGWTGGPRPAAPRLAGAVAHREGAA